MARTHLKRKLDTYQALACINQHFQAISRHVFDVQHTGFFPGKKMPVFQGLIRELQCMISHDIAETLHDLEDQDMFEFGKIRIQWEHDLNPSRPAFTVAQTETQPKTNGHAIEDVPVEDIPDSKVN